jgi:hypothetical protein
VSTFLLWALWTLTLVCCFGCLYCFYRGLIVELPDDPPARGEEE